MIRRPPRATRPDTLCPSTPLCLAASATRQAIRAQALAALPDRRNAGGQRTHLRHIASPHRRSLEPDILGMPVEFADRPGGPFDRFHSLLNSRQRMRVSLSRPSVWRGSSHGYGTLAALHDATSITPAITYQIRAPSSRV